MPTAEYQRRATRPVALPADPGFLAGLARRLVDGDTWHDIARDHGTIAARFTEQGIREAVQPHVLALVEAEQPLPSHRRHGTRAAYVAHRCRCEACRYAVAVYEQQRERKHRRGLTPYVPADPVRAHLAELSENGIGWKRAAQLAGVPSGAVSKLLYGAPDRGMQPSKRVRRRTAEKLLAVRPMLDLAADGAYVPGDTTWARYRMLREAGATRTWIGEQLGVDGSNLRIGSRQVTAATARRMRKLHEDVLAGRVQVQGRRSRWDVAA